MSDCTQQRQPGQLSPDRHGRGEEEIDLDRLVWDPDYRREVRLRLAEGQILP